MTYCFRKAAAHDAEFVLALYARPHVAERMHAPSLDDFLGSLDRTGSENLILECDGKPFGNLAIDLEQVWLLTIRALAVWEARCGAGRFAMEYALRRGFDELGAHRIFLEVLENNAPARKLYERVGFRAEGLYRDGYRDESGTFWNLVPYGMVRGDR
jgi:GNAT superfamily N-acetyltransferase